MENKEISSVSVKHRKHTREIGVLGGTEDGPVLIFVGGIHGNEPSGILALEDIFEEYSKSNKNFRGKAFAFSGNLKALEKGQRFIQTDLNRLWHEEQINKIEEGKLNGLKDVPDVLEQIELFSCIKKVLAEEKGPFMFFDLHTTSSPSAPFVLVNDTMINRRLAERYPLRVILGIEEYLEGPMLSYINDQGFVSLGFEAGQHEDPNTFDTNKAFILQTFLLTGFMKDEILYEELIRSRKKMPYAHSFFEVRHKYRIKDGEEFKMMEGYVNFSKIQFNQLLARNIEGEIRSKEGGYLFMPLYQKKGGEGFYIINLIPNFWLRISSFLRKINFDYLLLALPGVNRYQEEYKTLIVDVKIARYLSRQLFHLLGYRRVKRSGYKLIFIKRESI